MPKLSVKNANVTEITPNTTFPIDLVSMCLYKLVYLRIIFIYYNAQEAIILHGLLLFKKK